MALEDELVNAKRMAQRSANQLLELQFQELLGRSTSQLETTILKIEKGIGVAILVDTLNQKEHQPLLLEYADKFVVEFLGYLKTGILHNTQIVELLIARRRGKWASPLVADSYHVERTGPGHFQIKRGSLTFPIVRKYADHTQYRPPVVAAADTGGSQVYNNVPPQRGQDLPRESVFRVIVGTARDLYRAIRY